MEESKGNGEALVGSVSECTVAESGEQTLGQVQGSFGEGFDGGSCNGDDLMVEVLGSEVYVGGVCTSGTGENLDEAGQSVRGDPDVGSERPKNESGSGGGGGVCELGSGEAGVSCTDGVSQKSGNDNEGPLVDSESVEAKDRVSVAVVTGDVAVVDVVIGEDALPESGMEVDNVSNVELVTEDLGVVDKEAVLGDSEQEMEIQGGTGGFSSVAQVAESQIADEDAKTESEKSDSGLAMKDGEQDGKVAGEDVDASNDSTAGSFGTSEEALNLGIGSMVNSATRENAVLETQVHEEITVALTNVVEIAQVVEVGDVGSSDKGIVSAMETDDGENFFGLEDKEQVKGETPGGSTENHDTDSRSTCPPTQVVVEIETTVTELVSVSEQDKAGDEPLEQSKQQQIEADVQFTLAKQVDRDGGEDRALGSEAEVPGTVECLKSVDHLSEGVSSEISPVSVNARQVGSLEEHQVQFENQQETICKMGEAMGMEKEGHVDEDTTSVTLPTQVGGAGGTPSGDDVPDSIIEGAVPLPSGNDEDLQAETATRSTGTENQVSDYVDISPMDTDEVLISDMEVVERLDTVQKLNTEESLDENVTADSDVPQRNIGEEVVGAEQVTASGAFGLHGEQDSIAVKDGLDGDQLPNFSEEIIANSEFLEPGSSLSVQEPCYELPPEHEGVLSVPDLVWGKVKSHPWWPGQIFDFTDASEKAMKHHKKDCLLVAYFGDRTFSWNEESTLRSFRTHFSQMVAQTNGETFHKAVNCALEEVSRRVELGLACPCVPKDSYDNIRIQVVENAGIRSESSRRDGVDESTGVSLFQAAKLVEYVRALAQCPLSDSDALGLTVAKAQLLAFGRFRGYCSLPEFQFCGDLVENDTAGPRFQDIDPGDVFEHPLSKDEQTLSSRDMLKLQKCSHKRKHNLRDGIYPKIKEKSLSELMGDTMDYPDEDHVSGKRRKSADNHAEDSIAQDGRKPSSLPKVSTPPKQSFKIGECIRRVASQMTGSPSVKGSTDRVQKPDGTSDRPGDGNDISLQNSEGKAVDPAEYSSLDEILLQLQLIAQDPRKGYNFSNVIINFFTDFRNSVVRGRHSSGAELVTADRVGGKRKKGSPETFEFDDMNDTYWTDRVIQNGVEPQPQPQPQPQPPPRKSRKKDNQLALAGQPEKTPQARRPYNRKKLPNGNHTVTPTPEKPPGYISENAPAELIMNFSEVSSVPSESNLNKMFRRFGPLKETETEVDRESSRARVVFKKCSDAEVAFNSAGKFNIFGPTLVNYQLNYNPVVQYKPSPLVLTLDHEMQLDLSAHDHEMQLDLSTHEHEMHLDLSAHDHEMQLDLSNLSPFEVNLV